MHFRLFIIVFLLSIHNSVETSDARSRLLGYDFGIQRYQDIHKRDLPTNVNSNAPSEGGNVSIKKQQMSNNSPEKIVEISKEPEKQTDENPKHSLNATSVMATNLPEVVDTGHNNKTNITIPSTSKPDINSPGVLKRALIVFGGFSLLAIAYYIFFKRKGSNTNLTNSQSNIEFNQFRYGVLQTNDQGDHLEQSRMPLTMDSEDEDEDLEIFDLSDQRKSLSHVGNQSKSDVDLIFPGGEGNTQENTEHLLLDIEDVSGDKLLNWSNDDNKPIL